MENNLIWYRHNNKLSDTYCNISNPMIDIILSLNQINIFIDASRKYRKGYKGYKGSHSSGSHSSGGHSSGGVSLIIQNTHTYIRLKRNR